MEVAKLEKLTPGYLYLTEVKYRDREYLNGDWRMAKTYGVTFANGHTSVTFTVPEDMLPDVVGYDALTLQLSKVLFHKDGEE